MGKFDFLDEALNETSKAQMNTDKMIDIDKIVPYELNEYLYPQENDIEIDKELIESIRENGLNQSVELMPHPTKKGFYISVGGNRRCRVIRKLVHDEELEKFRMVKSKIVWDTWDEDRAVLFCMQSNNYREITEESKVKMTKTYLQAIEKLEKRGEKITGGARLYISTHLKVGSTQAGKLIRIAKQGTEELTESIEKKEITIEAASAIALLEPKQQHELVEKIKSEEISNKEAIEQAVEIHKEQNPDAQRKAPRTRKPVDVEKTWKQAKKLLEKIATEEPEKEKMIKSFINSFNVKEESD